jgi:hypothetical protein
MTKECMTDTGRRHGPRVEYIQDLFARLERENAQMQSALSAIYEAGRMSDQSRAIYMAEIAKAALAKV